MINKEKIPNVTLVIPSLDPDDKLVITVEEAIANGFSDIILIDDGSHEENKKYFRELDSHPEVTLLTHEVNRGKGAALKTAFSYFLENRSNSLGVITADGDGQHRISDIFAAAREMTNGTPAVILGCRDFSLPHVPSRSRFGNKATSLVFRLFCGMKISDTQTGLRAIPREFLPTLITAKGTRYEYETNMLLMMSSYSIPYREVKIETVYYDNNEKSHFRPIRDSIRVYGLIFKYAISSIASSVVDLSAFFILSHTIFYHGTPEHIFFATFFARVISVIVNFSLNKKLVFDSRGGVGKTFFRYVCLAVPIMLSSAALVYVLSHLNIFHGIDAFIKTLIKLPVDVFLFLISFRVQQKWVFSDKASGGKKQ